jgi:hypothetical protein
MWLEDRTNTGVVAVAGDEVDSAALIVCKMNEVDFFNNLLWSFRSPVFLESGIGEEVNAEELF